MQERKPTRLKGYDYSEIGSYFITICSLDRKNIFSQIVGQGLEPDEMQGNKNSSGVGQGLAPAEVRLSELGKIAESQLLDLSKRFNNVNIDKYVIMPNHIHFLLSMRNTAGASPCPTVSDIVCAFKSLTSIKCKSIYTSRLWQTSFYDHIIRDEADYRRIWNYIDTNPGKWSEDKYYVE